MIEPITTKGVTATTRRLVAAFAAIIALAIVVCTTLIIMSDRESPDALLVALGAAVGVLGSLVAGVRDGT